jgi:hypothetical protein
MPLQNKSAIVTTAARITLLPCESLMRDQFKHDSLSSALHVTATKLPDP